MKPEHYPNILALVQLVCMEYARASGEAMDDEETEIVFDDASSILGRWLADTTDTEFDFLNTMLAGAPALARSYFYVSAVIANSQDGGPDISPALLQHLSFPELLPLMLKDLALSIDQQLLT